MCVVRTRHKRTAAMRFFGASRTRISLRTQRRGKKQKTAFSDFVVPHAQRRAHNVCPLFSGRSSTNKAEKLNDTRARPRLIRILQHVVTLLTMIIPVNPSFSNISMITLRNVNNLNHPTFCFIRLDAIKIW